MAKVTDLNAIADVAGSIIDDYCPSLVELIGHTQAIFCVVAIYTTNDVCKGYGQDFTPLEGDDLNEAPSKVSVISFQEGISVIVDSHSSRYQDRFSLCGYVDLNEDIVSIVNSIQAAFDRLNG